MVNWQSFWNSYPTGARGGDPLAQVGKTVAGVPISPAQLETIVTSVRDGLDLRSDDVLLDLCCGNGVVTRRLAEHCRHVVGVDFSTPLIESAKRQNSVENVEFVQLDARALGTLRPHAAGAFTKVLCYEALAFFDRKECEQLLADALKLCVPEPGLFIGSVLDRRRRGNFFNTLRRKCLYWIRIRLLRREVGLGRWWTPEELAAIGARFGFRCEVLDQDPTVHTAHYRFDMRLRMRQQLATTTVTEQPPEGVAT